MMVSPARWLLCLPLLVAATAACAFATPPTVIPAQGTVEVAFSPWGDPEEALLRLMQSARSSIRVQAYLFTSRPLAAALLDARRRGVRVEVLADREQATSGQIPLLAAAGVPVRVEVRYAAAHNKIVIVDGELPQGAVATGSFNFTWSAKARNAENLLILRGNPALVRAYLDNWLRHASDAVPYDEAMLTTHRR